MPDPIVLERFLLKTLSVYHYKQTQIRDEKELSRHMFILNYKKLLHIITDSNFMFKGENLYLNVVFYSGMLPAGSCLVVHPGI